MIKPFNELGTDYSPTVIRLYMEPVHEITEMAAKDVLEEVVPDRFEAGCVDVTHLHGCNGG